MVHVLKKSPDASGTRWKCNLTETEKIATPLRHFSITPSLLLMIVIAISPIVLVRAPTSGTIAFATSGLAGAGVITFPNSNGNRYNNAAEPALRADGAGNCYGSSENGLTDGTDAWRSTDGGLHYLTLVPPNSASAASNQHSPA